MIRSATDFLPLSINTLMNLATSGFANLGSGRISRLGISRRRGIDLFLLSGGFGPAAWLRRLWSLAAVLRARLLAVLDAGSVERAAHHVVTHARQILDPAAPNQHHRVLLQVVAFATDVADDLEAVGQAHLGDLPQRRVRLLRSRRVNARAYAALLRAVLQRRHLAFGHGGLAALPHELIDRWHPDCPFRASTACRNGWAARSRARRRIR